MEPAQVNFYQNVFLGDVDCIEAVLQVYSAAKKVEAFQAAVLEWRKRNPAATVDAARVAVANIISNKA
jgi:hypothetical protein